MKQQPYLSWLNEISEDDSNLVGRKSLALLKLSKAGIDIPLGFVVLPTAFDRFLEHNYLHQKLKHQINSIDRYSVNDLNMASARIGKLIESSEIPKDVALQIFDYYQQLGQEEYTSIRGSVLDTDFSSSHHSPFLNIKGDATLLVYIRKMWSILFTPAVIIKYFDQIDHKFSFSIIIEKMLNSESSGIAFTTDPSGVEKGLMFINAELGIKDNNIKKIPYPDLYKISRSDTEIISKEYVCQQFQIQRSASGSSQVEVAKNKQNIQKVNDENIRKLSKICKLIHNQGFFPQKIEWAIENNKVYILDTQSISNQDKLIFPETYTPPSKSNLLEIASGISINKGLVTSPIQLISTPKNISSIIPNNIIIIPNESFLKLLPLSKIKGIVVEDSSTTHQNILYLKSSGIPSIIANLKTNIKSNSVVTLDSSNGILYKGSTPSSKITQEYKDENPDNKNSLDKTATKLFADISHKSKIGISNLELFDGIGLIKSEFIIQSLGFRLSDLRSPSAQLLSAFKNELSSIVESANKSIIFYRLCDEEMPEPNQSISSMRGSLNFLIDSKGLEYELDILFDVIKNYSENEFHIVLPFIRSAEEINYINKIITTKKSSSNIKFKIWAMIETPSAVFLLDEIIKTNISGVIVGLNDLSMYTFAVDRSDSKIQQIYSQTHPAIQNKLKEIINTCHNSNIPCIVSGSSIGNNYDVIDNIVDSGAYGVCIAPEMAMTIKQQIIQAEKTTLSRRISG